MTKLQTINYYLLHLLMFLMPIDLRLSSIVLVVLSVFCILEFKDGINFRSFKENKYLGFFILFYVVHVFSLLYSDDKKVAGFDLEVKLAFVIVPVIFGLSNNIKNFIRQYSDSLMFSFLFGLLFSLFSISIASYYKFTISGSIKYLTYSGLALPMHSSYFALYICVALVFVMKKIVFEANSYKLTFVGFILSLLLSFSIIMVGSKAGIFSLVIVLGSFILYTFLIKRKRYAGLMYLLLGAIALSLVVINPVLRSRVAEMKKALLLNKLEDTSTSKVRLVVWKTGIDKIMEKPIFGFGNGDVGKMLAEEYKLQGFEKASEKHLNPHNQYIQTALMTGFVGLILLLALLFVPMYIAVINKDWSYFIFSFLIVFNLLVESMFERQAGILFFTVFSMVFYFSRKKKETTPDLL